MRRSATFASAMALTLVWYCPTPAQDSAITPDTEQAAPDTKPTVRDASQDNDQAQIDLKSDVLEWVDQLDAASLSKRKAAEKSLIEAGPKALQFLPESRPDVSVEAAERLARVRKTLMGMRTETQSAAITVRLDKATTLGEALEAISRDSGVEFEHRANESTPIEPVATPLSFWHAVDLVLDQAELDINFYAGDRGILALVPREEERPSRVDSAAYAGVYRIEPTSIMSSRVLNSPSQNRLNIRMEIAWEPRLTPIGLSIPVAELAGKLDDSDELQPQSTADTIDIATSGDIAFSEVFLPMELPSGRPSKVESLAGVIRAMLPGKKEKFELKMNEPNASKKIDAMTVRIEQIRRNGPLHEVRLAIELDDASRSLESHRHWVFENPVHIIQEDGSRADHLGFEVFRQTKSGVGVGYLFDLGDSVGKSKLVYESPTAVVNNEVEFVIQDIMLP